MDSCALVGVCCGGGGRFMTSTRLVMGGSRQFVPLAGRRLHSFSSHHLKLREVYNLSCAVIDQCCLKVDSSLC